MPLIILDGVDGAGKSTLADNLIRAWKLRWGNSVPARLQHRGPFTGEPIKEYLLSLDYDPDGQELLVLDRWYLSELVYGPLMRKESLIDENTAAYLDKYQLAARGLGLIVTAPLDTLSARLKARGEDFLPHDLVSEVDHHFRSLGQKAAWSIFDTESILPSAAEILRVAERLAYQRKVVQPPAKYIGPLRPTRLLVLDPGKDKPEEAAWPGAPVWQPETRKDLHRFFCRSVGTGIIHGTDLTVAVWARLGRPTLLAETGRLSEELHGEGWHLVDTY